MHFLFLLKTSNTPSFQKDKSHHLCVSTVQSFKLHRSKHCLLTSTDIYSNPAFLWPTGSSRSKDTFSLCLSSLTLWTHVWLLKHPVKLQKAPESIPESSSQPPAISQGSLFLQQDWKCLNPHQSSPACGALTPAEKALRCSRGAARSNSSTHFRLNTLARSQLADYILHLFQIHTAN